MEATRADLPPERQRYRDFKFTVGAVAPVIAGGLLDVFDGTLGWGAEFGFNGMLAVIGVAALLILRHMPAAGMAAGKR